MSTLAIQLADGRTAFQPGETIRGQVSWQGDTPPTSADLRLFWSTTGRGTDDMDIVQSISFSTPGPTESRPFALTLPEAPYSFNGSLIFLTWTLELVLEPGPESAGVDLIIAPGATPVNLSKVQPSF